MKCYFYHFHVIYNRLHLCLYVDYIGHSQSAAYCILAGCHLTEHNSWLSSISIIVSQLRWPSATDWQLLWWCGQRRERSLGASCVHALQSCSVRPVTRSGTAAPPTAPSTTGLTSLAASPGGWTMWRARAASWSPPGTWRPGRHSSWRSPSFTGLTKVINIEINKPRVSFQIYLTLGNHT